VNVQYESRRLYSELDRAKSRPTGWPLKTSALQVEKRAQATSAGLSRWPSRSCRCGQPTRPSPPTWPTPPVPRKGSLRLWRLRRHIAVDGRNEPQHRLHLQSLCWPARPRFGAASSLWPPSRWPLPAWQLVRSTFRCWPMTFFSDRAKCAMPARWSCPPIAGEFWTAMVW
jgi:hypothetical protein